MKAVTWQGVHDMQVTEVPDPRIEEPTDAIIKITSTGPLRLRPAPLRDPGALHGGRATSSATSRWGSSRRSAPASARCKVGDRVVVPFNVCCGTCWMCERQLYSQCETTQNHEHGTGASFFGYSKLYGQVPGGQAEYLRVPFARLHAREGAARARRRPVPVPLRRPADRVAGAEVRRRPRRRHACWCSGAGPIGDMAARMGVQAGPPRHLRRPGPRAAGPRRGLRGRAARPRRGREGRRRGRHRARDCTDGRGPDAVIDAVGMEAHGSAGRQRRAEVRRHAARRGRRADDEEGRPRPARGAAHGDRRRTPRRHGLDRRGVRRLGRPDADDAALRQAGAGADGPGQRAPLDRRAARAAGRRRPVRRRRLRHPPPPAREAPSAYEHFQKKEEGMVKVVFQP